MFEAYPKLIFLILTTTSLVYGECPNERIRQKKFCEWSYYCIRDVRDVTLPDECRGSVNYNVSVDLTVHDPLENYDGDADPEFLRTVTSFQALAVWPETRLSSLIHMPKLKKLILSNNQMKKIHGSPFFTLSHLQHLDLSDNSLSDIDDLFQFEEQKSKLTSLFLSNNAIENIRYDTFSELTDLKELDLSHNLIFDLTKEPFDNLTSLEILRLNNNRITDLDGAINTLEGLKHLYLSGNQIVNIDERSLKVIHHLETFDAAGNQLEKLRPILFLRHWEHIGGVCKILLSGNRLTSIPNGKPREIAMLRFTRENNIDDENDNTINTVETLTEIDLSNNNIYNVERNAFQTIMKMTYLDLSQNKLEIFFVNPEDLKHVKFLNLSSNLIADLNFESFVVMNNLQNLDLSNNRLSYIPDETFINNYMLKSLNMTYNHIYRLDSLHIRMFHTDGGILDLSHNDLSRFTIPDRESVRLNILALNFNNIVDATDVNLERSIDLKVLELNNNKITKLNITSLRLPFSVNSLDLSRNNISDIGPSTFYRLRRLRSLFLGHNELNKIEYGAFQGLTDLLYLDLSFNNIHNLDSKLLMDLKSLSVLSLRSNELNYIDYKGWLSHKYNVRVYLDDTNITCEWLGKALSDYNNGYSKMRPTVLLTPKPAPQNSLDGIPCIPSKVENLIMNNDYLADERLLLINQKILEAVNQQNDFLKCFMRKLNIDIDTSRCQSLQNC